MEGICLNKEVLEGNEIAPPLVKDKVYKIVDVYKCSCGQEHYDVGLVSKYNWVSCYKCKNPIPKGDQVHWCHPSRFQLI